MENVEGIHDRRESRKFIGNMLRKNYIKHTVNKLTFSENSYYQFGEGDSGSGCLLNEDDGKKKNFISMFAFINWILLSTDSASTLIGHNAYMLDDSESIISDHISNLPSHVNALPNYQLGPPPSLPAPECFMPNQAHYFTVGSSVSGANDPNYYVIEKPMSMISNAGLPHLQKASSKSSTTSKSCSSTESQKYMIKNLIQQTNHSKLYNHQIIHVWMFGF